ncbi:MAG: TonB-dependent receptor [Prevotellaceae bacterium]|jgi:TonB-linked SusC/RagA family outer membrane protein|nr:TonB-dependent receptor [Prevotellaceae bacterium]
MPFFRGVALLVCLLLGTVAYAQPAAGEAEVSISGTVTDKNRAPLAGVSVVIKGSPRGAATDGNGSYDIRASAGAVLVFSFLGMEPREEVVDGRARIDVALSEDTQALDEVVVTALGIKRAEKALSYNVQTVDAKEISTVKSTNFMNALAGKVAGVSINNSATGPGAAVKVVMRGAKSLSKSNNALYVIDGIPMYNSSYGNSSAGRFETASGSEGAADINPDDIESISLLTGPSAAALYGYEGANGVVLITTKKGNAEKTSLLVSNSTTFSTPLILPEFQNVYGNKSGSFASWGGGTARRFEPEEFFNTGHNVTNSISLSTGNKSNQSYISAATTNATGILPNNDYNRYNFALRNTTSFLNEKFVLSTSADYIKQDAKNMVAQGEYFNPLPALYLFPRGEDFGEVQNFERYNALTEISEQYWPYGQEGLTLQNPYWIMNRMNRETSKNRYRIAASLQYNFSDYLNIIGRANIDNATNLYDNKFYATTTSTLAGEKGRFKHETREERQTYADVIANFNKNLYDFSLSANAGASIKDMRMSDQYIDGHLDKIANFFIIGNLNRLQSFKTYQDGLAQQSQSVFVNAEVGFKSMLYLTLTGRNDWDSALAFSESGDKSFFYPSVGLSALVSEMLAMPAWISLAKARLSYTSVGTAYDPYITQERYKYEDDKNQFSTLSHYPNRNLKPELTNSWEAGINLKFLKNTLTFDATWYRSNTLNQTFTASLSASSGYSDVYVQAGDVQNSGVELALGYHNAWRKFSWSSNVTYSYNDNVVKNLANGVTNPVTGAPIEMPYLDKDRLGVGNAPLVRLTEGGTMGDIWTNREWKRNRDGSIAVDSKGLPSLVNSKEYRKIGSLVAKGYAGWRNSFSYAGVSLNVLLSARFGGVVVSGTQATLDRYGVSKQSAVIRQAGGVTVEGIKIPAEQYYSIVAAGSGEGDFYVYSADNIRLSEVSLEYTLPRRWLANAAELTLGVTGNNLLMLYCDAPFDPELVASATGTFYTGVDYFMMPSLRNVGFSVKLAF